MSGNGDNTLRGIEPGLMIIDEFTKPMGDMMNNLSRLKRLNMDYIKDSIGVFFLATPLPVTGMQQHGDSDHELHNKLIIEISGVNLSSMGIEDDIHTTPPYYMDKVSRSVCEVRPPKRTGVTSTTSGGSKAHGQVKMMAPPCFDFTNEFEIGEEVLILPAMYLMHYLCNKDIEMPRPRNALIYDFILHKCNISPLFVLEPKFKVMDKIEPKEGDRHEYWSTYILEGPGIGKFQLPPSMMCRQSEIVPFLS